MISRDDLPGPRALAAFLGAAVLLCGISTYFAFNLRTAPDEGSHHHVVVHHSTDLSPVSPGSMAYGALRGHPYYLHSPVPYASYVPLQWVQDTIGPVEAAQRPERVITRLGGLVVAVAQLAVTILLVRRLARRASAMTVIAVATAVNLVPQLRYLHAYINADAVTVLAGTAALLCALRILQREQLTLVDAAITGGVLALLALSRLNVAFVAVVLAAVYAVRVVRIPASARTKARYLGLAIAIPVVLAGPFHLHVYNELDTGDLLPSETAVDLGDSTFQGQLPERPSFDRLLEVRNEQIPSVWMKTWLWFADYAELWGPPLWILLIGTLAGVVGLVVPGGEVLNRQGRVVALAAVGAFLATWAYIAYQWFYGGQHGRFLLPAGITALAGVVVGLGALLQRIPAVKNGPLIAAGLFGTFLLGLNVWAMTVLP